MATLLSRFDPDDRRRRCDDCCHRARRPDCLCICGGVLHGTGTTASAEAHLREALASGRRFGGATVHLSILGEAE